MSSNLIGATNGKQFQVLAQKVRGIAAVRFLRVIFGVPRTYFSAVCQPSETAALDPSKLIELLKMGGWQAALLSAGAGLFLYLSTTGVIPKLDTWIVIVAWVVVVGGAALALAANRS